MIKFKDRQVILLGFICATLFWSADVFIDVVLFHDGRIMEQLLNPSPREFTLRGLFIVFFAIYTLLIAAITRQRDRLEDILSRKAIALETLNRELEAFSYSVSHDLRKPLTVIFTAAQALEEKHQEDSDELTRYYIGALCDACRNMDELIDALQLLAQISGREVKFEHVDLSLLAKEISSELGMIESERRVAWNIAPGLAANGDSALLRVLMENLLGNAWKYTSKIDEPEISFGRCDTDKGGAFYVRDNGAGFDMELAGDLFKPFVRLHSSKDFPGTGIGLATVQRIIDRHRGSVWAEGVVAKGATFYFILPEVKK
jgi:light-regulated signal transduction histidine kinase (bacteriophytochrome)